MPKEARTARLATIRAGVSKATSNVDTVVIRSYVNDRKDYDRPIDIELTSKGARDVAAQLIREAECAERAVAEARARKNQQAP
ncbi:hypothetical protein [Streptomyces sp. CB02923]|uniref:hypothetical protein n=1 Tax=Streptomyces sp. CB02923 TaxID=1718985 RepID=UPI0019027F9F|nr:hypothetical protein [Streptomyces sp. CB02923]